jgi:DNA-binding CsgD family transcriptional regulator
MVKAVAKRPRARVASALDDAYRAFYDAKYADALSALDHLADDAADGIEALLLRARASLRDDRLTDAYEVALQAAERASSPSESVVAQSVLGAILRALQKPREAALAFERAAKERGQASPAARSEFAYYAAAAAWEDGELHAAETLVEEALPEADDVLLAMLIQLLGWIEVRRERYAAAADRFIEALEALGRAKQEDLRFRGRLVHGLAVIASETIDLKLAQRYEPYLVATRWTTGITRQHFNTVTAQRFLALLQGDLESAWFLSREAVTIAPTDAFRAIAETNGAVVSVLVGDAFAARAQLGSAWHALQGISWSHADEEERVALTNFAIEAVRLMPAEARSAVTLYRNITGAADARLALHGDRRLLAFEAMAAGRLSEALGKSKEAIANYERSRQLWVALDYRMRAALVAGDLLRLTGDQRYAHDVGVALARAPKAWFRDAGGAHVSSPMLAQLTRAERTVLRHLLGGENIAAIATALGRSPYTVHNHTRRIFSAFKVRTRAALFVRCAEERISADSIG